MPRILHSCYVRASRSAALLALATSVVALAGPLDRPAQDEVVYQIMPIAWRDSDNDTRSGKPAHYGDFNGLTASLPYLDALGVTMLYLQPIFPSAAYHGYQHNAADTLNTWFGSEANFTAFVAAAHARNMKVVLDYVAYGISQSSTYYTSAHNNPASPFDAYLAFTNAANSTFVGSNYTTWSGANVGFINWNLASAGPVGLVSTWAQKWLDPNNDGDTSDGVDGYRLDHAYANSPEGWGATISFWQTWAQSLRLKKPGVFIFCEPGDWGNYGTDLMTPTGFDAVLTKPFEFAARDAVNNGYAADLYDSVQATLAAIPAGKTVVAQINDHDSDRLASTLGSSIAKHKSAAAVLLTQPFPPSIYYGDEIGMRGIKANFGSDANDIPMREPFKWNAAAGAPMSNYFVINTNAYNARTEQNNDGRSVEEQQAVPGSLLETYRSLIAARKGSIALRRGTYTPIATNSPFVWAFVRRDPAQSVLVAINLSGSAAIATCNLSAFPVTAGSTTPKDLLTGADFGAALTTANRQAYTISLAANEFRLLEVGLNAPPVVSIAPTTVDGRSIPTDFGANLLRATQTIPTSMGDNTGELDQLYVRAGHEGLRVGITGNLPTDGSGLVVWLDASGAGGPAGVSTVNTTPLGDPPAFVPGLNGTRFDSGFTPGTAIVMNASGGSNYFVDQLILSPTGAVKIYRGKGTPNSGLSAITGGSNTTGLALALDNTNTQGITGASAATAPTATTGVEILIPYGDAGLPLSPSARAGGTLRLGVALVRSDGSFANQTLPPVASAANLGLAPNFATVAGNQFAAITLPRPGDFGGDGAVSVQDIFDYLAAWFGSARGADFNGDGAISVQDLFDFLAAWFTG